MNTIQTTLFPLESAPKATRSFYARNLRIVSDVVREVGSAFCSKPEDTVAYMAGAFDQFVEQEQVWVVLLDARHRVVGRHLVTVGTMTQTLASPREVFRVAIIGGAHSIVIVHNHPSGDPSPSSADARVTRTMQQAGELLGIILADHVVIGSVAGDPTGLGYYSFREAGRL